MLLIEFEFLTWNLSTNWPEVVVYTFSTSDQFVERFHGRNSNFAIAIHSSSINPKDAKTKLEIV